MVWSVKSFALYNRYIVFQVRNQEQSSLLMSLIQLQSQRYWYGRQVLDMLRLIVLRPRSTLSGMGLCGLALHLKTWCRYKTIYFLGCLQDSQISMTKWVESCCSKFVSFLSIIFLKTRSSHPMSKSEEL